MKRNRIHKGRGFLQPRMKKILLRTRLLQVQEHWSIPVDFPLSPSPFCFPPSLLQLPAGSWQRTFHCVLPSLLYSSTINNRYKGFSILGCECGLLWVTLSNVDNAARCVVRSEKGGSTLQIENSAKIVRDQGLQKHCCDTIRKLASFCVFHGLLI